MNSKYYVNKIIQGGIYYLELSKESKQRPYLIISKDDYGYGQNVLAFSISEKFTSCDVNLPIVINKKISFIRISAPFEVPKQKIIRTEFDGLLRPDILDLAIRMFTKRFSEIDEMKLEADLYGYLTELEKSQIPLYVDNRVLFRRDKFLSNEIYFISKREKENAKIFSISDEKKQSVEKKSSKIEKWNDYLTDEDMKIEEEVLTQLSLNQFIKFQKDMRVKSNNELERLFCLDKDSVVYIKQNIRKLIKKKEMCKS